MQNHLRKVLHPSSKVHLKDEITLRGTSPKLKVNDIQKPKYDPSEAKAGARGLGSCPVSWVSVVLLWHKGDSERRRGNGAVHSQAGQEAEAQLSHHPSGPSQPLGTWHWSVQSGATSPCFIVIALAKQPGNRSLSPWNSLSSHLQLSSALLTSSS